MRAIFMIPSKPPPKLKETDKWTPEFIDFIAKALVKKPEDRATCQVNSTNTALFTFVLHENIVVKVIADCSLQRKLQKAESRQRRYERALLR
jgi:hypothetical protein